MDPFTLLMAAQGIVAGIRQGCELLSQGKAQISEAKKAVEQAQAFVKEAKGLWGMVVGLWRSVFGGASKPAAVSPVAAPEPAAAEPKAAAKKAKPRADRELSYEEFQTQAVHDICEKLKQFFEIKRQLHEYCRKLEEESKTTKDIEGAALDRIQIEMQLEQMTVQIRETMIYTPKDLGLQSIYTRFLKMYDQILEEREFDRRVKLRQQREEEWQRDRQRRLVIDKLVFAVAALLIYLELVGLYLALSSATGWPSFL